MATIQELIANEPTAGFAYQNRIADWTSIHKLTADEVARLESVLVDYSPDEVAAELDEELRCVFGARKLATMPELTTEDYLAAAQAFESGRTPFKAQDVD